MNFSEIEKLAQEFQIHGDTIFRAGIGLADLGLVAMEKLQKEAGYRMTRLKTKANAEKARIHTLQKLILEWLVETKTSLPVLGEDEKIPFHVQKSLQNFEQRHAEGFKLSLDREPVETKKGWRDLLKFSDNLNDIVEEIKALEESKALTPNTKEDTGQKKNTD